MAAKNKSLKPLHLASSVKELNEKSASNMIQSANPKLLCKSADKLHIAALEKTIDGDQEATYVLLLRYLDVVSKIRSSKEYKLNKKLFDGLLDMKKFKKALDDAESLASDLEKRYQEAKTATSGTEPTGVTESHVVESLGTFISPERLYKILTDDGDLVLVLDCRPRSEYVTSHVDSKKYPQWLSVPEEVIGSRNLATFMSSSNQKLWDERGSNGRPYIVLVDKQTDQELIHNTLPIISLKEKLEEEKLTVSILEGGYNMWYLAYAPLCVGKWKERVLPQSSGSDKTGGELSYPTLPFSNNQVQDNNVPHPPSSQQNRSQQNSSSAPSVNRSTKPATGTIGSSQDSRVSQSTSQPQQLQPRITHDPNIHHQPVGYPNSSQHNTNNQHTTNQPITHFSNPPMAHPSGQARLHPNNQPPTGQPMINPTGQPMVNPTGQPMINPTGQPMVHPTGQPMVSPTGQPMVHPTGQPMVSPTGQPMVHPTGQPMVNPTGQPMVNPTGQPMVNPTGQPMVNPTGQPMVNPTGQPMANQPMVHHVPSPNQAMVHATNQPLVNHPIAHPISHTQGPTSQPVMYPPPTSNQSTPTGNHTALPSGGPLITQQTGYYGDPLIPHQPLPPPPSVNLPLDLEGRGLLFSNELEPQPLEFLDEWYPPTDAYYHDSAYSSEEDTSYQHNAAINNNPRQAYGPLPVPPNYEQAQLLPSYSPVQPPLPPPVSLPVPQESNQPTSSSSTTTSSHEGQDVEKTEQTKVSDFKEEVRILVEQQLETERAKMKEELREEREKNKAMLAEERKKQEEDYEQRKREMEVKFSKMKEEYEKEKKSMMKQQEEMKHYWQSRQVDNEQQRPMIINQGLPSGWEKRLDRTTGRFYYIDHNTHTTHWNPPTSILQYQTELAERQRQMTNRPSPAQPSFNRMPAGGRGQPVAAPVGQIKPNDVKPSPAGGRGQVSPVAGRGQVSPVAGNGEAVGRGQVAVPSGGRGQAAGGGTLPLIDRTTKPKQAPPMSRDMYRQKILSLQPVRGGIGAGLTGLRNLGNTCFMSSVIQCLCATPPLVEYFYQGQYRTDLNRANPLGSGGILAEEFYILVTAIWLGEFRYIVPRDFKNTVSQVAPYFAGNDQHDSQEFLVYLLDGLHEDLNKVLVKSYVQLPDTDGVPDSKAAEEAWQAHKKRNDSVIINLFHGLLKSTITCLSCGKKKVMFEPFVSLSVPIPRGKSSCSYHDCLKLFTAKECMTGTNKWFCPTCKASRDSEKTLFIWRLPPVLLLHFKRFQDKGNVREKLSTSIKFPLESLDLSHYVVGPQTTKQYNLFAISNHTGNLQSGHYTATCKHPRSQRFNYFDDQDVRQISSQDINSSSAYLLFYISK